MPSGGEHALPEYEIDISAFSDSQAQPDVHLRANRPRAHGLLRGPLGGHEQGGRHGPATPGRGVGVAHGGGGVIAEFGVLVNDDDECGLGRAGLCP